ncbi:DUF2306 domain-containing protein [Streptomyces aidingensis]|uniref:Uncharacterized membrane protein n=1 Tax=Streptomyces aidingensis TaxID=910347 RepID=A0A1I1V4Q2_9ACTN|nr:DUF2306 domain-containing protein [Streptomyces aidingensis]SFD76998.1 Uncharacterized membrane protein [Streptomyces aidingensis]
MTSTSTPRRFALAGLLALAVIPSIAGVFRIAEPAGGADITPENARFFASPAPVVVHILAAVPFGVLGAFQFVPAIRRRHPGRHRAAGRFLVVCGLAAALSGLWMTLFYPRAEGDGGLLTGVRLVFGLAMAASLVLAFTAVRRRDLARHRAWMLRGYAIGMGAGTQTLLFIPAIVVFGPPGGPPRPWSTPSAG